MLVYAIHVLVTAALHQSFSAPSVRATNLTVIVPISVSLTVMGSTDSNMGGRSSGGR